LIAERLPAACGHDHERIALRQRGLDGSFLQRAQGFIAPRAAEDLENAGLEHVNSLVEDSRRRRLYDPAMRGSRIINAVFVMALSSSAFAQLDHDALLAPLPIRDQFLLNNGFFFFEPEQASVLSPADSAVSLTAADSNTFAKSEWISHSLTAQTGRVAAATELASSRFRGTGPLFLADGETHRLELSLRHGFANHLELGITLPVTRIGGGWTDRLIELTHHALGIGNANRGALRENSESVYIATDSLIYMRNRSAGYGLGDIALTGKYELTALEDRKVKMALAGGVELPTGDARKLEGSGSVDAGVQLIMSRDLSSSRVHISMGMLRLGSDRPLGTQAQIVITNTIAAARMINDRTSAALQLTISECPFRHLGMIELTRHSNQLSAGIQRQFGRSMVAWAALIENVLSYENSADAGIAWGVSKRF